MAWIDKFPDPPQAFRAAGAPEPDPARDMVLLKPVPENRNLGGALAAIGNFMMGPRQDPTAAERVDPTAVSTPTGLPPAKKSETLKFIKEGKALDPEYATDSDIDFSERKFKFGEYIDCLDCVNKWAIASIVRIDGNRVEVHYDGWGDKWNETLDAADPRIRPLGSKCTKEQVATIGKPKKKDTTAAAT